MKRYLTAMIFAMAVVGIYHFVDVPLFNFDLTKRTKEKLFSIRAMPNIDPTVVLFNVGKLQPHDLQIKIDSLLLTSPKKIGINLCHWKAIPTDLIARYRYNDKVIFANCNNAKAGALGEIIEDHNVVTHFKTDRPDYFELKLTDFKGRGNATERINYGERLDYLTVGELNDSYFWFNPDHLKGKTILLGYMGDYLTDTIYYFQNCRITPLNHYYGESNIIPDMYDVEISANILRTINNNVFINEVNPIARILIILAISIVNVAGLTFIKTRWTIINLIIAAVLFVVLTGAAGFLLVYLFHIGYFLEIDELPLVLLITTAFTVVLNITEKKETSG